MTAERTPPYRMSDDADPGNNQSEEVVTQPEDMVVVPRAALAHVLDWHNKTPCGEGQDSLDEVIFETLIKHLHEPDGAS